MNRKLISIVAPMFNEEQNVVAFYEKLSECLKPLEESYKFEVVMVNDGSQDKTYEIISSLYAENQSAITVVSLSRNYGLEGAVHAGLQKARGEAVIVMDTDLQDPPELIPQMISKWESGVEVVVCARVTRRHDSSFKRLSALCYYRILDSLAGKVKLPQNAANYRLLSRKALNFLLALPEVNTVFRVTVPYIGMKTAVVEYDRGERHAGETKYNLKTMVPYALNSITSLSVTPLRKLWFLIPLLSVLMVVLFIIGMRSGALFEAVFAVLFGMAFFTSILIFAFCVVAEYVGQIFVEVKRRPISIVEEYRVAKNAENYTLQQALFVSQMRKDL